MKEQGRNYEGVWRPFSEPGSVETAGVCQATEASEEVFR